MLRSLKLADYGFEYSDEEVEEEDVDIENQYYNSKGEPVQPNNAAGPCCVSSKAPKVILV